MAFDTKESNDEQNAYLQSEVMQPVDRACLEFWYYMDMWYSIGTVSFMYIKKNCYMLIYILGHKTLYHGN